jgi:lipopolysaccharide biosynthesis regulator YciM
MTAWGNLSQEFSSPLSFMLAGTLVCLAILLMLWRRPRVRAWRWRERYAHALESEPFQRSFDLLLDARWKEAAEVLKTAVKHDANRTLEYLELGKLFRRHGDPSRAARMFEQLLARAGLDSAVSVAAQYELASAYQALGWHEFAITRLEQVLGANPCHAEARRQLRCLHEELGCWESAAAVEMLRLKRGEARDRRTLAALLTQQGKEAWAAGDLRASAAHLQSALKLDPDSSEAALCLGRILLRQGKLPQAFQIWDGLAKRRPEWLFLAFDDLQAAFRQLHNEAGWEGFLRTFTQRYPDDPAGYLALAEWYGAHDQSAEALQYLRQVLALDPLCRAAQLALLSLYRTQGVPGEVLDDYERLVSATTQMPGDRFRCRTCGQAREEPFWKCPSCHTWATPERLLSRPSPLPIMPREMSPRFSDTPLTAAAPIAVTRETPDTPAPSA